jgi:FlaG/FlaF family flagellin (archaellin)
MGRPEAADMEVQLLKRRLSTPRAATVVVLAATVAVSVTVVPSLAQSFLTNQRAAKVFVTNKKASQLFLKKEAAGNLFVKKATAPKPPVLGIAAGTAQFGPVAATTAGYIPTAFTAFATKAEVSSVVITFSGSATCTSEKASSADACPVQILIDGQSTGKVNFAPATLASQTPVPLVHTIVQTTVLGKGGHTVAIQYAGAKNVTFTLKNWNLAAEAIPQPEEVETTSKSSPGGGGSKQGS